MKATGLNNEFKYTSCLEKDQQVFTKNKEYDFFTIEHSYTDSFTRKLELVTFYRTVNDLGQEVTMSKKSFSDNFKTI